MNGETEMIEKKAPLVKIIIDYGAHRFGPYIAIAVISLIGIHAKQDTNSKIESVKSGETNVAKTVVWKETGDHFQDLLRMVTEQQDRATIERRVLEQRIAVLEQQMKGKTNVSTNN